MASVKYDVWMILAKVTAVRDNPVNLAVGSEALVQCFIPESVLEKALIAVHDLLDKEGMKKMDILSCRRYDRSEKLDSDIPDYLKRDVLFVRKTGRAMVGTFFISQDSAAFTNE